MLTEPRYLTIEDMPFLIRPLEQTTFNDRDTIYVVLSMEEDGRADIIDVGQSSETGAVPMNHPERMARWKRHATGQLLIGAHRPATDYNMPEDRARIIEQLRRLYRPPCNVGI